MKWTVMKIPCWALLFVSGLAWSLDRGDSLVEAETQGVATLRVLWVASSGWAETGADGQPEGFTIDLMQEFARWLKQAHGLDVGLHFVEEGDWRRFYDRVRAGEGGLFGLGNVTITEQRRRELSFSPPYARNVAVLITHADRAEILRPEQMPEALAGRRAMAFAGTLHESRLQALKKNAWPDMPMDFSVSNREILDAVAVDTHFAYIDGYNYLQARGAGARLRRHPALDDSGERFGVIMPLGNDWQALLERFFADAGGLPNQAWYRASLKRHLGEEIAEMMSIAAE